MISFSWLDDVAVVTIDNPPVNASTQAVRAGLIEAIGVIVADGRASGIVLTGAGKSFVAGSDIKEFGAPIADPQLPQVLDALVNAPVPVVAAIDGFALGGGLELALACDLRVATQTAVFGLPEVTLGLVPGAGGTQRLPRLVGIASAIDLAATGKRIGADGALKIGLIDAISGDDLLSDAISVLRESGAKGRIPEGPVVGSDPEAVAAAIRSARAASKGRPAASRTIELVLKCAETTLTDGLRLERDAFNAIRVEPEAFAYRHLFFAERKAGKIATATAVAPVSKVAVIGAGTMGVGIAYSFASAGYAVTLIDSQSAALERAVLKLEDLRVRDVRSGRMTVGSAEAAAQRVVTATALVAATDMDLVVEAVFEDIEVKKTVLAEIGAVVAPHAIIATNTSYLDIGAIAVGVAHPERFLGMHFFAPANVMKLVEVVRTGSTSDETTARILGVAKHLGKQPVIAGNGFGFIGNRIYAAYRKHAEYLVMDGASPAQVDAAMTAFGMAMGPFAVADLSGLDIAWRMRQARRHLRLPDERYVDVADRLCEMNRLGRKTKAGYYDYSDDGAQPSPIVADVIAQSRADAGVTARAISDEEIVGRCLGAMANEAAHLMAEGVAQRASDVDVVMVHGYGFPRWQGGLTWWVCQLAPDARDRLTALIATAEGPTFRAGNFSLLAPDT